MASSLTLTYKDLIPYQDLNELTDRLTQNQIHAIDAFTLKNKLMKKLEAFITSIVDHPYQNAFLWRYDKYQQWPALALLARRFARINDSQVATVAKISAIMQAYLMETGLLSCATEKNFYERAPKINESAKIEPISLCQQTDQFKKLLKYLFIKITFKYTAEKVFQHVIFSLENMLGEILKKIEDLPISEQCFFRLHWPFENLSDQLLEALLKHQNNEGCPLLFFTQANLLQDLNSMIQRLDSPEQPSFLVFPSFSLAQIFLDVLAPGSQSIRLVPVFGAITEKDIFRANREHLRFVNIGMEPAPLPSTVKGCTCSFFSAINYHEYLAWKANSLSKREREATNRAVVVLLGIKDKQDDNIDPQLETLITYLQDGDHYINYRGNKKWGELFELEHIADHLGNEQRHLFLIIEDMVENKQIWDKIRITKKDLTADQQRMYDRLADEKSGKRPPKSPIKMILIG